VKDRFESNSITLNTCSLNIGKHLASLTGFFQAQQYLARDGLDAKLLTRAFRLLPHLNDIRVADAYYEIGAAEIVGGLVLLDGSEVDMTGEHTLPVLVTAIAEANLRLDSFRFGRYIKNEVQSVIHENIEFSEEESDDLTHPYIVVNSGNAWLTATAMTSAFVHNNSPWQKCFRRLRILNVLELGGSTTGQRSFYSLCIALQEIIRSSNRLEVLRLGPIGSEYVDVLPFRHSLLTLRSNSLRCLDIQDASGTWEEWEDFLYHNSRTLATVTLQRVSKADPENESTYEPCDWSALLTSLRSTTTFPALTHFGLVGCSDGQRDDGVEVRVEDYLKGLDDYEPLAKRRLEYDEEEKRTTTSVCSFYHHGSVVVVTIACVVLQLLSATKWQ